MVPTDPFEILTRMSPPADEVRVARVRERVGRLLALPDDAPHRSLRSRHGLVVTVVAAMAATLTGTTVAAAANGTAPEPVTQALISVGVLDAETVPASPEPPPRRELDETLREDLALTVLVSDVPATVEQIVFELPDGTQIPLTRTPDGRFIGALASDALDGPLIALSLNGTEAGRVELATPLATPAVGQP
jgi:hypothetical protein